MMAAAISKIDKDFILSDEGVHTKATVHTTKVLTEGQMCTRLYYEFTLENGLKYTGDTAILIDSPVCELQKGDNVTVVYLPRDPTVNQVESSINSNRPPAEIFFVFPLFFLVFFAPTLVPCAKRILAHRKLYKTGTWTEGELIYIKDGKKSFFPGDNSSPPKLYVEFKTTDGTVIEAIHSFENKWLANNLKPGQKLNVIYQPSKPKKAFTVECYIR
jgi:hypothetical protein